MNTFDFYTVTVSASRVSDLKALGIDRSKCRQVRDGFKSYGRRSYPVYRWDAVVANIDVVLPGARDIVADAVAKFTTATTTARSYYHARD